MKSATVGMFLMSSRTFPQNFTWNGARLAIGMANQRRTVAPCPQLTKSPLFSHFPFLLPFVFLHHFSFPFKRAFKGSGSLTQKQYIYIYIINLVFFLQFNSFSFLNPCFFTTHKINYQTPSHKFNFPKFIIKQFNIIFTWLVLIIFN